MKGAKRISADAIKTDTLLSSEEAKEIRETVIRKANSVLNMRGIMPQREVNAGKQTYEVPQIEEQGEAGIVAKGADYPVVTQEKTRDTQPIKQYGCAFELYRRDILAARDNGEDLPTQTATSATRLTAVFENDLILNGDSTYGIDGLLDQVGDTESYSASSGWDTGTVTEVQQSTLNAIKRLADGLDEGRKVLVVNKATFYDLALIDADVNRTKMDVLMEQVDEIVKETAMPDGTALLMVQGEDVEEFVIAEDINVTSMSSEDDDTQKWKVRGAAVPAVNQSGGLVEINGV